MAYGGYVYEVPEHIDLRQFEWLPVCEAAKAVGYCTASVDRIIQAGLVPKEKRPRPRWRKRCGGPVLIWHVHVPSLREYQESQRGWMHQGGVRPAAERPSATRFGTFLRRKRRSLGIGQKAAAKLIGVTNNEISCWELGRKCPNFQNIVRLADLYNMSLPERWAMVEAIAWAHSARHLEGDDEQ